MTFEQILKKYLKMDSVSEFVVGLVLPVVLSFFVGYFYSNKPQAMSVSVSSERQPASINSEQSLTQSVTLSLEKNHKQAIADIKKAIKKNPKSAGLYNNLASYYAKVKYHKQAEKYYKKALSIDSQHEQALFNTAVYYEQRRHWKTSLKYYKKYLEAHPKSKMAFPINNRIRTLNSLIASRGQKRSL